jgi:transposase
MTVTVTAGFAQMAPAELEEFSDDLQKARVSAGFLILIPAVCVPHVYPWQRNASRPSNNSMCDRQRCRPGTLQAIIGDRNQPRKHLERARIVLACAEREPAQRVAARVGVSRPTVWRWQQRYAEVGVEGLLRDKTRKPGKTPIAAQTTARVVTLTCTTPPHQATHWTGRAMGKAVGISLRSVQRIWQAHQLQPHRIRTFKRSRDPSFAAKLADVVGLYVDPPAHDERL